MQCVGTVIREGHVFCLLPRVDVVGGMWEVREQAAVVWWCGTGGACGVWREREGSVSRCGLERPKCWRDEGGTGLRLDESASMLGLGLAVLILLERPPAGLHSEAWRVRFIARTRLGGLCSAALAVALRAGSL